MQPMAASQFVFSRYGLEIHNIRVTAGKHQLELMRWITLQVDMFYD